VFKSRVVLLPLTFFRCEDIHYQRPDFQKDPSSVDTATGGFGVMADFKVCYRLWRGLFADIGYRVWDVQSGSGETLIRSTVLGDVKLPFNEGTSFRQGLILGLSYHF
jgi:hypothetical protein